MLVIHKYAIPRGEEMVLMPQAAVVLSVQFQDGVLVAWAIGDTESPAVTRRFLVAETGQPLSVDDVILVLVHNRYRTTVQSPGGLVYHVFDLGER